MCHCALIDKWILFYFIFYIVFCPQVTCGWRDVKKIQELRRGRGHSKCGHDMNMTDSWWTASAMNTANTEEYREWPTEQYTPWTLQTLNWHWTLHTLNPTLNWILDWTLPTLNNSRQTMNAVDCKPANTEHHWLCMLQTLPYRLNALKKLNWCYRLGTLLALNAIELSRPYRLTLNTVYTES